MASALRVFGVRSCASALTSSLRASFASAAPSQPSPLPKVGTVRVRAQPPKSTGVFTLDDALEGTEKITLRKDGLDLSLANRGIEAAKMHGVHAPVWHLIDAEGYAPGKLAAYIANLIRGKHKPIFDHAVDNGDHVVVINAEKVEFSGNKWENKRYVRHSGYPGGQKWTPVKTLRDKRPEKILEFAVRGMLSHSSTRDHVLSKMHVFKGTVHPYGPNISNIVELPFARGRLRKMVVEFTESEVKMENNPWLPLIKERMAAAAKKK
eukprot:Opistho-2@60097